MYDKVEEVRACCEQRSRIADALIGSRRSAARAVQGDKARGRADLEAQHLEVFGMKLKAVQSSGQLLACVNGTTAIKPSVAQSYLERSFGDRLGNAEAALQTLSESYPADEIGSKAYSLYAPAVLACHDPWHT